MSLPQVVAYALQHNSDLLRTQYDAGLQQVNLTRTKASVLPSLNGQANHNYNFGRTIDPTTNQFINQQNRSNYFSLNAQVTLFDGLRQLNSIRQSQWEKDASNFTLQKKKDDVSLNVANQYLQILLLEERKKQLENLVGASRLNHDKTKTLVDAGAQPEGRLLEADAQLASDEANVIELENQIDKAYLALKQYINYDVSKPLKIQHITITVPAGEYSESDLNKIINERLSNLPGVQSAQSAKSGAEYGLKMAFGNISPKLSAGASLSTAYSTNYKNYTYTLSDKPQLVGFVATDSTPVFTQGFVATPSDIPFGEQVKNNFGQSLGFSLQIPIFNGLQNHYNIQSARINLNNATQMLSEAENQAKNDIYQAYEGMRMARKKLEASSLKLKSQQALFSQANTSYQLGVTSFYDWSLAQNNLSGAESDALQARYEYVFQVKVFEYYLGKPVEF
jgi:outer membrane protein